MARNLIDGDPDIIHNWPVGKRTFEKVVYNESKKFGHYIVGKRWKSGYRVDMCASKSDSNCPKCNIRTSCPVYNATKAS